MARFKAKTIEEQVADTILQQPDEITIGGRTYPIGQPTPATLIMVSGLVSQLPEMDANADNILIEVLAKAKDCRIIGKVLAALILGAKRIKENHKIKVEHTGKRWSWKHFRFVSNKPTYESEYQYLSKQVLDECTVEELRELITKRLLNMQVADFFGITTSLCVANLLKATKEVETQSGD